MSSAGAAVAIPRYLPGFEREQRDLSRSQWFSPPATAELLWDMARKAFPGTGVSVLEPAAGHGALIKPMLRDPDVRRVTAVDIDRRNIEVLRELEPRRGLRLTSVCCDFLACTPRQRFDLVVANPPYEHGLDTAFIQHALGFAPTVVGIYRSALVHGEGRFESFWRWHDMPRLAWMINRPEFGEGNGARSDFIAGQFVRRAAPRQRGEVSACLVEWW